MPSIVRTILAVVIVALVATVASADSLFCHKTILKQYTTLKKKTLKGVGRCLDKENLGKLPGPCPDAVTAAKLAALQQKVELKVAMTCNMGDFASLGFTSCSHGLATEDSVVEASCRTLPTSTPAEMAACISCWKNADFTEFLALLYASHAVDLCGGALGIFSPVCSAGGCSGAPGSLPDQRDLGDTGENDCQRAIGRASIKYLVKREQVLEKCGVETGIRSGCLGDPEVQAALAAAELKKRTLIQTKCGNRDPQPNLPFCCKTMGNSCVAAADRATCETGGGQVQEGKTCGGGNTCDPVPGGNQKITWWSTCDPRYCGNYSVTTLDDLIDCVDDRANEIVDSLLCYQFPMNSGLNWPCPTSPSGAFVD